MMYPRASNIWPSLIPCRDESEDQEGKTNGEEIIIAVMGETGSGKSSFIQRVTRSDSVKIGHGLESGSLTFSNVCTHH
jgi:predicted GTPase